ncbi:MAG: AAA family ATPase [Planctomycetaceae bacterium]|nr:AAA family ATPase [Planctomycetaceae bacterium]
MISDYLQHGWKLCFAPPREKNPGALMGRNWGQQVASTDAEVDQWLTRCPDANVGVLLGPESGLVDVEFDTNEGEEILNEILDSGPLVQTPSYTSGKSVHRLYKFTGSLPEKTVIKHKGVEVRINANRMELQSILPPSVHASGKQYEWLEGLSPADVAPQPMPFELLDHVHYMSSIKTDDKAVVDEQGQLYVPEGSRHEWMLARASQVRDWGASRDQVRQILDVIDTEIVHYDDDGSRDQRLDSIADWVATNIKPQKIDIPKQRFELEIESASSLLARNIERDWVIEDFMVLGEPMVVGGPSKCLKTSFTLDLAASIATGTKFMGTFNVPEARPVAVISGESGELTIQSFLRDWLTAKDFSASDLENLKLGYKLPKLDAGDQVDGLITGLKTAGVDIVIIDPLYRSLRVGEAASNIYSMGEKLEEVAEKIHKSGITVVLVHHFRKQGRNYDEAPELEALSQSGVGEFGRQFMLVKRREEYGQDGNHTIWFQWGGSAGHQGLRICQAVTGTQKTGTRWDTELLTLSEYDHRKRAEKEKLSDEKKTEKREQILAFLTENPGASQTDIEGVCEVSRQYTRRLLGGMESDGLIEVLRNGKALKFYRKEDEALRVEAEQAITSEAQDRDDELRTAILDFLRENPGAGKKKIEQAVEGKATRIAAVVAELESDGEIRVERQGRKLMHLVKA